MLVLLWAIAATVAACVATVVALRSPKVPLATRGNWRAPVPDPGRYQVVFHYRGETRELYHGYDALKARHAYELAPMEPGMTAEFYEWGARRGSKTA